MPASYPLEALKAQAVAARTFAYYEIINNNKTIEELKLSNSQCYIDQSKMKNKWLNDYNKYYQKIKKSVYNTSNEVVYKNNSLLKTFYFSTSNGYTRDSQTVFGESNINSVNSEFDKNSKDYYQETIINENKTIKIIERDKYHNVISINIDGKIESGIDFRAKYHLRSTDFELEKIDNGYLVKTYGYGHGVGMSQYGASYLAGENFDYKYILNYFYQNIEIKNINV